MRHITLVVVVFGLAACAAQPMKPAELTAMSSSELCIGAARMFITGKPQLDVGGKLLGYNDAVATLRTRGEGCEPQDSYMKVAYERIQLEQQDAAVKAQQSQALSAALLGASQVIQQQQMIDNQRQQNAILQQQNNILQQPVTTRCSKDIYGNSTCTSY